MNTTPNHTPGPGPAPAASAASVGEGDHLRFDDVRLSERARKLIHIGEVAIAREDDEALDAYFASDYVLHVAGTRLDHAQLKAAFAAYRASFSDFSVTRQAIIENGDFAAARTTMSGIFTAEFNTPFGPAPATGKRVTWTINNIFRYNGSGQLVEEWVQYDTLALFQQLGIELKASFP